MTHSAPQRSWRTLSRDGQAGLLLERERERKKDERDKLTLLRLNEVNLKLAIWNSTKSFVVKIM